MSSKNNRAPLLCYFKLCASFHSHWWFQTGVTVWKQLSWVLTSVTLTFHLWPWAFAWTLLLSLVITPENFMMIRWWEHSEKGVTDGQTENTICRAAWSHATSSFVHHFVAIGEFKLELQSGNPQFGSKSMIFFSRVTLQFDGWPWKTIGHFSKATSSFVHHFIVICEFKLECYDPETVKLGCDFCDLLHRPHPGYW